MDTILITNLVVLQDAKAPQQQMQIFYTQMVLFVRQMYQECHLVHADLSEYNILVHNVRLINLLFSVKIWRL